MIHDNLCSLDSIYFILLEQLATRLDNIWYIVDYKVPIINLLNYQLNEKEYDQLKMGINHCFINEDNDIKKHIEANMEPIVYIACDKVDQSDLKNFHEFLWGYADIFAKNVIST